MAMNIFKCSTEIREGKAPEWIECIPSGTKVTGRDGRSFTNDNPEKILNNFSNRKFEVPVDENHSSCSSFADTARAVGWVKDLKKNENNSIWAKIEWTDDGQKLIEDRAYKYVSPVFTCNRERNNPIRELISIGLTNNPNLEMTALNRREMMSETESNEIQDGVENDFLKKRIEDLEVNLNKANETIHDLSSEIKSLRDLQVNSSKESEIEAIIAKGRQEGRIFNKNEEDCREICKNNSIDVAKRMIDSLPSLTEPIKYPDKKVHKNKKLDEADLEVAQLIGKTEEEYLVGMEGGKE